MRMRMRKIRGKARQAQQQTQQQQSPAQQTQAPKQQKQRPRRPRAQRQETQQTQQTQQARSQRKRARQAQQQHRRTAARRRIEMARAEAEARLERAGQKASQAARKYPALAVVGMSAMGLLAASLVGVGEVALAGMAGYLAYRMIARRRQSASHRR